MRDGVIRRAIGQWLRAGVREDGRVWCPEQGTPQGGVVSPLLSNVFLHEVLDTWFHQGACPRLRGRAFLVRYADDAVLGFEYEDDARRVDKRVLASFAVDQAACFPRDGEQPVGRSAVSESVSWTVTETCTSATRIRSVRLHAVKMSLQANRLFTKPACIAGVRVSRPNRNALCGRMKL